jgi:hypothetical protein
MEAKDRLYLFFFHGMEAKIQVLLILFSMEWRLRTGFTYSCSMEWRLTTGFTYLVPWNGGLRTGFTYSCSMEWRLKTGFLPSGVEISSRAPHSRQLDCSDSRPLSLLHGLGSV